MNTWLKNVYNNAYDYYYQKALKGGPGSGNFGHEGRPGEVGGSGGGGGSTEIKKGSMVRFKQPENDEEKKLKMRVIEDRGDRVLVESMVDMQILPTSVYSKDDLEVVN